MPAFLARARSMVLCSVAALGLSLSTAHAGVQDPGLTVHWTINGTTVGTIAPVGVLQPNGFWNYIADETDAQSGVHLVFNLNGDPDPQISGGLIVTNPALPVVNVVLVITLPIAPQLLLPTQMLGSASVGLTTDGGGGTLGLFNGSPGWQGMIDGNLIGGTSIFLGNPVLTNPGFGSLGTSGNFGIPVPLGGPPALASIGIRISFSLTQFDQLDLTSLFRVTPAPGALALLGLGALGMRRRRR